jgi:hypothetical protein
LLNPVTVIGEDVPVAVILLGVDKTRYVTVPPLPVYDGTVKATEAVVFPAVAVPIVGVPGIPLPEVVTIRISY